LADILDTRVKMAPPARSSRGKAFDAARQHSRRVRVMRFVVPLVALLGVVGFIGYAFFDPFRIKDVEVKIDTVGVGEGGRIVMKLPHLTGFNKKQQAYNVTATSATQQVTAPGLLDLAQLEAVISMADQSKSTLSSTTGKFDSNAQILHLKDNVRVESTRGYSAAMSVATIDFKAGTVDSSQPVQVTLANGVIKSGALTITNSGNTINFKGGVVSRFQRPPTASAAAATPPVTSTTQ